MAIQVLPPQIVNQIAAGEVVERPASAVKELIENAIDAAASRIDVAIEGGGRDLIRVTDNGVGIPFDELTAAVAAHATSKINSAEDLATITTLGFRGEALASLASVSRLSLVSRPGWADEAAALEVEGGRVGEPRPAPGPAGTTVTVRHLFFNTPARRRFLRAESTETGRVAQTVEALALGNPQVGFTLAVNGRRALELPAEQRPRQRMLDVVGRELASELLPIRLHDAGLSVSGLAGRPSIARGTARHLRAFVNGRPVVDRALHHAMKEAYRGLIDPSRYPTVLLFIEIEPGRVDVNVHPTKAEVRFRDPRTVHRAVLEAVREALRGGDLTPSVDTDRLAAPPAELGSGLAAPAPAAPRGDGGGSSAFVEYFRGLAPAQKGFVYNEVKQALAAEAPELLDELAGAPVAAPDDRDAEQLPVVRPVADVLQVHASYLVTQDERGLLIIDQHALHERVMFETLLSAADRGPLESQRLLMPAMIEVAPEQIELLETLRPLLERLGIDAEAAGPEVVAVHGFSSFLFERRVAPAEFLGDLLDRASRDELPGDAEAALRETLDMMACKAAVKAGDRLSPQEIARLLRDRERVERSSRCPHGRPTTLRLTIEDLERQFGRR